MTSVDFNRDKLYEIQEAFRLMKESDRMRVEAIMRDVFIFANSTEAMTRLVDEINANTTEAEREIITDLSHAKSLYDKAFTIYLNYPSIWNKACVFVQADILPHRFWTRYANLPCRHPRTDNDAVKELGQSISGFFWKKQIRGNKYHVVYERRTENEHYFLVFLSDYTNNYDVWEENSDNLVSRFESRPLNMVIIYDEQKGILEINAYGGREVYDAIAGFFSSVILASELDMKETLTSTYQLDHLMFPENKLMPMPDCGVMNARITGMDLTFTRADRRRCHKISIDKGAPSENLYEEISPFLSDKSISNVHVRLVRIVLDVLLDGFMREMCIEVSAKTCTLRSVCDELRRIGGNYIGKVGIDDQQQLNLF